MSFTPVATRKRHAGWSVQKQVEFLQLLATFGSVRQAARGVGMSESAAYRLRARPHYESFHKAWDFAIQCAGTRLLAVAVDRALHGSQREYWKDGELVGTVVTPSDKLLMWAVDRLKPGNMPPAHTTTPDKVINAIAGLSDIDLGNDDFLEDEMAPDPLPSEHRKPAPSRARANPCGVSRVSLPVGNPPSQRADSKGLSS